ncbi:MAG: hypothetical protein WA970_06200, partial [Gammaproteobacteria bacterium]
RWKTGLRRTPRLNRGANRLHGGGQRPERAQCNPAIHHPQDPITPGATDPEIAGNFSAPGARQLPAPLARSRERGVNNDGVRRVVHFRL